MVVNFRLGRLKNIAPVHKSKFRKRVEFILARVGPGVLFGVLLGALLGADGTPWDHFGLPWGHLGPPWPAMGCSGMSLGLHFVRLGRLFNILGSKF